MMKKHRPQVLINLAAATDVDGCEDRPDFAATLNSEGPGILAELCTLYDARFLHMSTDYVFSGTKGMPYGEKDEPDPLSVYGRSKLLGERRVMEKCPLATIVRTQWLYGEGGPNFITKIVDAARASGSVQVVDDQSGAPTYAKDLALPLSKLIELRRPGIYHVVNGGSCTWCGFAREIFQRLKLPVQVTPTTSELLKRKARRPAYSVFNCSKLTEDTGVIMRPWQEALADYLS